ncbi:MAG: hypothetical protein ABDH28_03270 [Brevinematia bacterium]
MWVNFGRGIIVGNNKYSYFTRYAYTLKYSTNGISSFNYPISDRNFDGVTDIGKGIGIHLPELKLRTFVLLEENLSFSNHTLGGMIEIGEFAILLNKHKEIFISVNYKSRNLLGLGIVSDLEVSSMISSNILLGLGWFLEWYFRKLEFSLECRVLEDGFYSSFSHSMFSRERVQKGLIFSARLDEQKTKFSFVNKLVQLSNASIESETYFFALHRVFDYTFLDLEILKDSVQEKLFLALYPFVSLEFVTIYLKPVFSADRNLNFEKIIAGTSLEVQNLKVKLTTFFPLSETDSFTFISTEVRDNFGENLDVKIGNSDGISCVVGIIFTSKQIKTEVLTVFSQHKEPRFFCVLSLRIE